MRYKRAKTTMTSEKKEKKKEMSDRNGVRK